MPHILETPAPCVHAAFGLRFRSHLDWLPLAQRLAADAPHDVDVTLGEVPAQLPAASTRTPRFDAEPGRLLFRTRLIADYLVEDGARVRLQPKEQVEPLKLCNLLFGGMSGALLIQRGTLALHGCSIATPGGAVVFCGDSGAGKSTLATALLQRGFRMLDDNIAALPRTDGEFMVQPGSGFLRLTADTLRLLGREAHSPGFGAPREPKYLHYPGVDGFCTQSRPLRHVFILDRSTPQLQRSVTGKDKLELLRRHTFMQPMVQGLGQMEGHFRLWLQLASSVPVSHAGQPPDMTLDEWADRIAALLQGC